MFATLIKRLQQQSAGYLHDLYWFIALLSVLPAIRANLLFAFLQPVTSTVVEPADETASNLIAALQSPFGHWVFALAAVGLLLALASKQYWRLLAPLCYLLLGISGISVADALLGNRFPLLNSLYLASAFLLFCYFVIAGSVRTISFAAFVAMLVVLLQLDELLDWPPVIVFVVSACVASLVVETIRQNWPLARQLGRSNLLGLTARTLKLWWPMLILIYAGVQLSDAITDGVEQSIYASGAVNPYCYVDAVGEDAVLACPDATLLLPQAKIYSEMVDELNARCTYWPGFHPEVSSTPRPALFDCPTAEPMPEAWPLTQLSFFDSADRSVERDYDLHEWRLARRIRSLRRQAFSSAARAEQQARELYKVVPEDTGMKTSSCGLLKVSCHAANIVINELNDAYGVKREEMEGEFVEYVRTNADSSAAGFQGFASQMQERIQSRLDAFERETRTGIKKVRTAVIAISQILLLWLIVVGIKSFLFVFARVIFDQSTDIEVDLLEHDGQTKQGRVRQLQEVDIPADYPHTLYYKANYQPLGPAPRFSIPQWYASILSRLRFGAWNMSQVRMPLADQNRVTFNSIEGEHLVDWTLEEGEEVVFSYRHFVAMNENIELRTVISLRVATLLLGRIVFHTARCKKGQGRLILRTRGKPATAEQVRQSIPVARLVAWNRYAKFSVDSHLTTADIFLNGFNLRRTMGEDDNQPQGILIVEADARDGGILVGTLRFAKTFLLPV